MPPIGHRLGEHLARETLAPTSSVAFTDGPDQEEQMKNWILPILTVSILSVYSTPISAQGTTAIRAGRLIDGTGTPARENMVIIVRGDRIEAVGNASEITIPPEARIIDLGQ